VSSAQPVAVRVAAPRHPPAFDGPAPPPVLDESARLALSAADALVAARALPLGTRFQLRAEITPIQQAFLDLHGFLVFDRVASRDEVNTALAEIDRVEAELLAAGKQKVNGVPVWFGPDPDGNEYLYRMGFSSEFSPWLSQFVRDRRFEPVRLLIGADARIGEREKDGVVFNRYVNAPASLRPNLAWHTDSLRDIFYNFKVPGPMLNVGLHFDRVRPEDGGLRLVPGTHTQGVLGSLFRKLQFVSQGADRNELAVETWPGDLTVHDGRMWHKVDANPVQGWASLRRSMYVPYVVDAVLEKHAGSPTPLYLRLFDAIIRWRAARLRRRVGR
jgi:hypothetical protein